jgi:hypothetical protein
MGMSFGLNELADPESLSSSEPAVSERSSSKLGIGADG